MQTEKSRYSIRKLLGDDGDESEPATVYKFGPPTGRPWALTKDVIEFGTATCSADGELAAAITWVRMESLRQPSHG
jgi:hypothetical protein